MALSSHPAIELPCELKGNIRLSTESGVSGSKSGETRKLTGKAPLEAQVHEESKTTPNSIDDYLQSWRLATVILSLCLGTFLVSLDTNVIVVAVPKVTSDFNSLGDLAWYGSAYLLSITACQTTWGKLYKYFDTKSTYVVCVAIFEGSVNLPPTLSTSLSYSFQLAPYYVPLHPTLRSSFWGGRLQGSALLDCFKALWVLSDTL